MVKGGGGGGGMGWGGVGWGGVGSGGLHRATEGQEPQRVILLGFRATSSDLERFRVSSSGFEWVRVLSSGFENGLSGSRFPL